MRSVDSRFGLPGGAFFAAVANNVYVFTRLPSTNRITLIVMIHALGSLTILLTVMQSALSL
jgi:hypothetical protein